MDLATLLAELVSHPQVVDVVQQEQYPKYEFHLITYVSDATLSIAEQLSVCILVHDRGGPSEAAYYKEGIPPFMRASSAFRSQVVAAIESYQVTNPELEYYKISTIDDEKKIAIIIAYMYNSGDDTTERTQYILIYNDPGWDFRKIVDLP